MRFLLSLLTIVVVALPGASRAATLLPVSTEDALPISSGRTEVIVSAAYFDDQRFPNFTPKGAVDSQHLITGPQLGLRFGVADWAEIQASYEAIYVDERLTDGTSNSVYGSGDARLFTKVRLWREAGWRPSIGLRFGAKLPNADFADRLGTDETDFAIAVLASKDTGAGSVHANLGLALLGNPGPAVAGDTSFEAGGQDDVFTWAFAYASPPLAARDDLSATFVGEFAGVSGSHFDNDRVAFRGGMRLDHGSFGAFAGVSAGLDSGAEHFGVLAGVSYAFELSDVFGEE